MDMSSKESPAPSPAASAFSLDPWLLTICLGGALIRAVSLYFYPNIVWADEIFQYVEPASRLLGGRALVPWEFQVGARSWLLPLLLTPAVALARLISDGPDAVYACVAAEMMALAALGSVAAYRIGAAVGSRLHALFAAFLVTFWCEAVYYSPHPLADTMSASLLVIALAASLKADTSWRLTTAGALLGLTFVVRLQLVAAIGLIGLSACWRAPVRRGSLMAIGFAAPILLAGVLDWVTWGAPFHSFVTYFVVNQGGVASTFGTEPLPFYLSGEGQIWAWATPLILLTGGLGARRLPVAALSVLAVLATFSVVPHKEYRFLYPAVPMLMMLCGFGTADIVSWAGKLPRGPSQAFAAGLFAAAWADVSLLRGLAPEMLRFWYHERSTLSATAAISADPAACGVAVDPEELWVRTGASRFRADLRLFKYSAKTTAAYNYVLAFENARPTPAEFHLVSCDTREPVCVYKREGGCNPDSGLLLTAPPPKATRAVLHRLKLL